MQEWEWGVEKGSVPALPALPSGGGREAYAVARVDHQLNRPPNGRPYDSAPRPIIEQPHKPLLFWATHGAPLSYGFRSSEHG